MKGKRAVVLLLTIIFTMIVSIVAAGILYLMSSQAKLSEDKIRRLQVFYAAQAAIQRNLMLSFDNQAIMTNKGQFPDFLADDIDIDVTENVAVGIDGTDEWINVIDYARP
ncbi:pilus assembly PilX N-terminal domain-containing protein [Candidatus Omnitrophota bacterium]